MELSTDELHAVYYVLNDWHRQQVLAGRPSPRSVQRILQRFTLGRFPSRSGHETDCAAGELDVWITTEEAAQRLGMHPRTVRRHRADLDGKTVAGRLVFRAEAVDDYARWRRIHD